MVNSSTPALRGQMTKMIHEIEIPIYTGKAIVCIDNDPWTALKEAGLPTGMKRKDAKHCLAWVYESPSDPSRSKARWIVAIKPSADVNTVAHECYHLTNYIAAWYGIEGEAGEDEPAAYIHGWLMEQIWRLLGEQKNGIQGG